MTGLRDWTRSLFAKAQATVVPTFAKAVAANPTDPGSLAEDNNAFALAMYGLLRKSPGNVVFSPFSVRTALAMARVGARGETREQMNEVLRFPSGEDTGDAALGEVIARLNTAGGGQYEMAVASSLWSQEGAPLEPSFVGALARYYGGGPHLVDFHAAEVARATINRWIEKKTRQRIRDLIPPGSLAPRTRLVLANAVYFKGKWANPFSSFRTSIEPFHLETRTTVQAPLMSRLGTLRYLEAPGYQVVELEYCGGELSLLVILPDERGGLSKLEKRLSERMLRQCLASTKFRKVGLFLPRFKIAPAPRNIGKDLVALGMSLPLADRADFSGINGIEPPSDEAFFISAVFHKAMVDVSEEGTEAAAGTGMMVVGSSGIHEPFPIFRADHPFLFAICDKKGGAVLFLGRVTDPTLES